MEKLYSLYNAVIERVAGYDDVLWADLDLERINGELQDFQSRSDSTRAGAVLVDAGGPSPASLFQDPEAAQGAEGVAGLPGPEEDHR